MRSKDHTPGLTPSDEQQFSYAQGGWHFVTLCTHDGAPIFGNVVDEKMRHNMLGRIAGEEWLRLEKRYLQLTLDAYVVMPNHLHGIIALDPEETASVENIREQSRSASLFRRGHGNSEQARRNGSAEDSLVYLVQEYKTAVVRRLNQLLGSSGAPTWAPGYDDRIIRTMAEHEAMRWYVRNNARHWEDDHLNN